MRKIQIIGLSMVLAFVFSSCGSLSISQKRYSRGLNIDWFSKKDDVAATNKKAAKSRKQEVPQVAQSGQESQNEIPLTPGLVPINKNETVFSTEEVAISSDNEQTKQVAKKSNSSKKQAKAANRVSKQVKKLIKPLVKNNGKSTDASNESDSAFILALLFAIFIPPIGVFLYWGEIETHFWINILLLVLAGGIYSSAGLVGISFAVIHALLVVFGVFG